MKKEAWKVYAFWIILTEAVGAVSAILTADGVKLFQQAAARPALTPPGAVFPIVWSVLYALMGVSAAKIALSGGNNKGSLALYLVQLAFNFFWSIIFFNTRDYLFAFLWLIALWILILQMIISFSKIDRTAALLQIPYLLWVTFAGYLNLAVFLLN